MGMGMLLKGKKKGHASSHQALLHLEEIHDAWAAVGDADDAQLISESLSLLEDEIALVHDALKQADQLLAFRTLEAIDLFLEEEDGMTWTGVEKGARNSMVHLLFSAWVTVVQQLLQQPQETRPENFKHVLKRAVTTGEELSMCEQGANIGKALDFLQRLASAPDEDAGAEDEEEEQPQGSKGGAGAGVEAELSGQYDFFASYQAYAQQVQARMGGQDEEDEEEPGKEGSLQNTGEDGSEDDEDEDKELEADFSENQALEATMLRDLLKERQPSGRLQALDSPEMRPVLLRVASRLPSGDQIRQEVESEVGGPPGSHAWQQALEIGAKALGFSGFPHASSSNKLPGSMPAPHPSVVAAAHAAHSALDSPTKALMHRALEVPGGSAGSPSRLGGFGSVISVLPQHEHYQQQQRHPHQPPQQQQQQQQQQPGGEEVGMPGASLQSSHGLLSPQPGPFPQSLSMLDQDCLLGGEGDGGFDDLLNDGDMGPSSFLGGVEDEQPSKVARLM